MTTRVSIEGDKFLINGEPTYAGREFEGVPIEGQLFNTRMVQAIFDDANPETAKRWLYPDTGVWDPERNVREFLDALPLYRSHGITAITVNLQGGMPVYKTERNQPWENSAFTPEGELKPGYMERLRRVIDACDELGIVVIVGYFYIAQTRLLANEAAVLRATDNATEWLLATGRENILVEIANEIDIPLFHHDVLTPARVPELIERVQQMSLDGRRLLVSASVTWLPFAEAANIELNLDPASFEIRAAMAEAKVDDVFRASDYILFHTNMLDARNTQAVIDLVKSHPAVTSRLRPLCINEDGTAVTNLDAAARSGIGWGYYDQGHKNDYVEGFQSPPVNWGFSTEEKRAFFGRVKEITGA
ncbi:hypothetical protein ABZ863_08870 [Saccharomonospora sp. NPDC046836]|uniref:hypothetical protein n=1 Tax=Saccharomonospora sp. NPDC046836 TaxID=3156921 RepID=UPI00340D50E8